MDASEYRREIVDESPLFLQRTGKMVVILHGWRRGRMKGRKEAEKNDRVR